MKHLQFNSKWDRRKFLKACGIMGVGVAAGGYLQATRDIVKFNRDLYKVSETRVAMGTFVSMTLFHESRDQAERAMAMAFGEMDRLTALLTRFDAAAPVSLLNQNGVLHDVPPELAQVVQAAQTYHQQTQGTFDITVKPVLDLFEAKQGHLSDMDLRQYLPLVDASQLKVSATVLRFVRDGMALTLDGIAKGYIVDRASAVLLENGVRNHLINAGGDIRTRGTKSERQPWTIAIEDPAKKGHYPDVIQMTDGAIATSGNYEVYYDREKMYHHIVNPVTGISPQTKSSVTVRAHSVMAADALSTALFVMDDGADVSFVDGLAGVEALVIPTHAAKRQSHGWKSIPAS